MRTKIDCCDGCKPPKRNPYCHATCPDYTGQRAELDENKADFLRKHNTASGIQQQRADGVARATRKRRL